MFRNSYFCKEIRQSNIENKISISNGMFFGVFTALFSYLIHMSVMRLGGTVVEDAFPYLLQADCFSPVYTYMRTFVLLSVLYFLVLYETISLSEIRSNRWYLLAKMGYSTKMMITAKTLAQFSPLLFSYSIGFAGTLGLAVSSNYAFSYQYLPALFLSGAVEIAFLCALTTALSLLNRFKSVFYSRCCIVSAEALLILAGEFTGFRSAISSKSFIAAHGMFSPFSASASVYFALVLVLIAVLTAVGLYHAKSIAMYYDEPLENTDFTLPAGRALARLDHRTDTFYVFRGNRLQLRSLAFNAVFVLFLCCAVVFALLLNLFLYYCKTDGGVRIGGYIFAMSGKAFVTDPYHEPPLFYETPVYINDFLVFKAVGPDDGIAEGKPVLIQTDGGTEISRYSSQARDVEIIGELHWVSRWLGAAVLLVNHTEGRILFLGLPLIMLLLYNKIRKRLRRKPVAIE